MSDVTDAVRTRLTAHSGTAALIGTRAWFLMLPQNPTLPASTVQKISATRESAMGDDIGLAEGRVQVRACAATRAGAYALAEQQRDALQRYSGTSAGVAIADAFLVDEDELFEDAGKIWSVRQDYMVWWSE